MKKIIYWLPRVLSIIFVCFLTLFSFDVFEIQAPWYVQVGAFFMHSIPSLILVLVTILAWKKPKIGGWLFVAAGVAIAIMARLSPYSVVVYIPPVLVGVLYLVSGRQQMTKSK